MFKSKLANTGTSIFAVMSGLAAKHGAINLSQGFPGFDCDPVLKSWVYHFMKEGKNQYAPMPGILELRELLSSKVKTYYNRSLNPETEVTITAGATQALYTAISAFVSQGDEVILIEPAYDCYRPAILLNGGIPVSVELRAPNYQVPWDEVENAITPHTKMLIVNNPHNPTGKIWMEEDVKEVTRIALKYGLLILSDEVYEHIVFDQKPHLSLLAVPELEDRCLATYSFGKIFHNTGWKMGYVAGNEKLMNEFRKVHQFNVFSVNTPIQYALHTYMQDASTYLSISNLFERKRNLFIEAMKDSPLKVLSCGGTYFILCDYSKVSDLPDREYAIKLTVEHGVASIPISPFNSSGKGDNTLRFCFAKSDEEILAAAEKLRLL